MMETKEHGEPVLRAAPHVRTATRPKRVLILWSGPMHEINDTMRLTMERLTGPFEGAIFTTMPEPQAARIGRFEFLTMKYRPNRRLRLNLAYLARALILTLRKRADGKPWDLVVTYDPIRTGLVGLVAARLSGAKFAPEVNGVYDSYANYIDLKPSPITRLKQWAYPRIVHFVLRRADGIKILFPGQVARCKDIRPRQVVASFFAYVDLRPFRDLGERKEVLFVGFPFRLKGVDILIDAFKRIAPKYPDWKLKIMGWYPDRTELDAHMDGHPQIFHQPPVLHSQIHLHIGACGLFVLPSRTEAMGRVLLESMAAGKPRIGADVDGIPTVIDNGRDGLLFAPGDAADLAAKLDLLMGDPELRRSMGLRGAERAREEFSADAYFDKLSQFYQKVLSA